MAFTVMTWNVENLFRPGHHSGPTTDDAYRDKLAGTTAMIGAGTQFGPAASRVSTIEACRNGA